MIFNNIHLDVSLTHGIVLLNTIIINIKAKIVINTSLTQSIPKFIRNLHEVMSMFMQASKTTHKNKYMKFLTFGTETSMASSVGDSFFIIRYALYQTSSTSKLIHSRNATC